MVLPRLLLIGVVALALGACGRYGDLELPPKPQPPVNGQPQPDVPGGKPGVKPIMPKGTFLLDPLL